MNRSRLGGTPKKRSVKLCLVFAERFRFAVVTVKDGQKLSDRQQFLYFLGQVQKLQLARSLLTAVKLETSSPIPLESR